MKHLLIVCTVMSLALASGCIPSHDVSQDEMSQWWSLTSAADVFAMPDDPAETDNGEGMGFPTHWTIRSNDSVIRSTVSLVRAMDSVKAGKTSIEFALAPEHIRPLVNVLADTRATMKDLQAMLDAAGDVDGNRWADTLAKALVTVERVSRKATAEATDSDEPLGMAAEPLLDMLTSIIDAEAGGNMLAELDTEELGRLRQSLVQLVMRMGFDIAGRQAQPELANEAARKLQAAKDLQATQGELTTWISEQLSQAPPAATSSRAAVEAALEYGPKAILMLERFLQQWPKMESISVDIAPTDTSVAIKVTLRVKDGQEIRIDNIMTGVPVIVFRGQSEVKIIPGGTPAGDVVIAFDPVGDGAVELRFEGFVYGLVRLFAFPLDSGPLREIRVARASQSRGEQLINVAVLMESTNDPDDPRRMLSVQDVRRKRVVREALETRTVLEKSETRVHYITPEKRYTYERIKHGQGD